MSRPRVGCVSSRALRKQLESATQTGIDVEIGIEDFGIARVSCHVWLEHGVDARHAIGSASDVAIETRRCSSMNAGTSAVSFMLWEAVKIAVSVAMLMLAPKLVQSLSWPALLVALVLCMKVYWLALLWRGRSVK